jgi:metal-responsive CopG/Arc/MetJ family transcriptional regulator
MKNKKNPFSRLTITLSSTLLERLEVIRLRYEVSVSAISEIAIQSFLDAHSDQELRDKLLAAGVGRRRT